MQNFKKLSLSIENSNNLCKAVLIQEFITKLALAGFVVDKKR